MYLKDQFEIMDTNLAELAEWEAFEEDMATDPHGDNDWADRMEEESNSDPSSGQNEQEE